MKGKRRPQKLKPLKRIAFPNNLIFFDCEAYEKVISDELKQQTLRLLTACYVRRDANIEEWFQTQDDKEFYKWVESKTRTKSVLYCFAHNLFYDLKISRLLENLLKNRWRITALYDNRGHGLIVELRKKDKKIVLLDTVNYFNTSVKKLGESIGLEKLDIDVFTEDIEKLKEYNKRDVEIIKEAILKLINFLKEEQICGFGYTIASLSLKAFRTRFLKNKIFIHANKKVDELEIKAYYGGRTEAFYIGRVPEKVYKVDINSMYPYVMKNFNMPTDLVDLYDEFPIGRLKARLKKGYLAIAQVILETNEEAYPYRTNKKLIFPIGRFRTYLSTPELIYALKHNHIVKIEKVAFYKGEKIFKDYIEFFYNKRLQAKAEGNEVYAFFYKIFMNSLYGKFAQRTREIVGIYDHDDVDYYKMKVTINGKEYDELRIYNQSFFIDKSENLSPNAFVSISAHITAYARMYLWHLIKTAGKQNVYYCDTDSLFINKQGYENLKDYIDPNEIGKLKVEDEGYCEIWGAKAYNFNNQIKLKGIPKHAEKSEDGTYYYWSFERFRGSFKYGLHDGIYLKLSHRKPSFNYDKRIVLEDGTTKPIEICEV